METTELEKLERAVDHPRGVAERYQPSAPERDELVEPDGSLRSHWRPLISMLDDMGTEQLMLRWDQARRLIRENGINHNVYGDPDGLARPWSLDLLPLLLPGAEWETVAEALKQRARLLEMIAADIYGPGTLLGRGLLPPELVYANPGFLRACYQAQPTGGRWLQLYAADLIRGPSGGFSVLADRTQAPSGAGYCLENRIVLTRVLPTAFAQCNVLRLAPFFISLRQTLASLAPSNKENPRIVLLTPGPYNETYFEHAYLARYLGYSLVQGNDLTVRDSKVYLKTLSGLQRVDVILRRVDDDYCDPLELFADSHLGVPGLLQAVREKTVAVANALGSGVLQAPALLPLLPKLCRHFLSQDLKLPSVQTWWCGERDSLRYVLENLKHLVVKPALPGYVDMPCAADPCFGEELSRAELDELAIQIRARPALFVAQEQIDSFLAPVFQNSEAQSRRYVVRSFLAASGESWEVMPGGLTRVTSSADSLVVSLQKGGGSKDTWVMAEGPVTPVTLLRSGSGPLALSRAGQDLPSRVADDLYWLGRYVQRAESAARLARCVFNRLSDLNSAECPKAMQLLMVELVGKDAPKPGTAAPRELAARIFSAADPSGLLCACKRFYGLARVLRDRISYDAWRILQTAQRNVADFGGEINDDQAAYVFELLARLVTGFLAFGGMVAESMTRGQSWRFLEMGLRIERGLAATRFLRSTLVEEIADPAEQAFLLDAILEVGDSSLTYRRRYLGQLEVPAVVDLLLADETNPRAVAYQAAAIEEHLSCMPREAAHPQRNPDHLIAEKLEMCLKVADLGAACKVVNGKRVKLSALLAETIADLTSISEFMSQIFFSHATVKSHQLSDGEA